jgi:hypothetical protein
VRRPQARGVVELSLGFIKGRRHYRRFPTRARG